MLALWMWIARMSNESGKPIKLMFQRHQLHAHVHTSFRMLECSSESSSRTMKSMYKLFLRNKLERQLAQFSLRTIWVFDLSLKLSSVLLSKKINTTYIHLKEKMTWFLNQISNKVMWKTEKKRITLSMETCIFFLWRWIHEDWIFF